MLPSKGYFRSIDCPFYKNNLCHRFYCHFRHNKKENVLPADTDLVVVENSNCDYSAVIHQDTPKEKTVLKENKNFCHRKEETVRENVLQDEKRNSFLPSKNIPQYNPTPISKLKTLLRTYADVTEQIKINKESTTEVCKDASIVETLKDYLVGDIHRDDITTMSNLIKTIEGQTENIKENDFNKPSIEIQTATVENNFNKEEFAISSINSIIQENIKLKEVITQLKSVKPESSERESKTILDNKTLLEDLMGCNEIDSTVESCYKENTNVPESPNSKDIVKNNIKSKKQKSGSNAKNIIAKQSKIKDERSEKFSNIHLNKHRQKKNKQKKSMEIKNEIVCSSVNLDDDPDIIIISDSEEQDVVIIENEEYNENSFDAGQSNSVTDYFPEPKKKVRISHIKMPNDAAKIRKNETGCETFQLDYPEIKQKSRMTHRLNYNTLSIQSMKDHLAHWQRVKQRVQKKCINPSGEEGYQNWSKVKISPVPNVKSLINSKKLLYSNIHQWKSKTNL